MFLIETLLKIDLLVCQIYGKKIFYSFVKNLVILTFFLNLFHVKRFCDTVSRETSLLFLLPVFHVKHF